MFQTFIGITALAATLSLLNKKILKLPDTIGIMILAIIAAAILGILSFFANDAFFNLCQVIQSLDFRTLLFEFLLGFLLFAGSIHVNIKDLLEEKYPVLVYATLGVLISTFIVGTLLYALTFAIGLQISYLYCLVFGSLISPTDPIAVLALLKKAGTSKDLEIKIVGESLFNDGVGIVVFLSLLSFATMVNLEVSLTHILSEFGKEVGGGLLLGFFLGYLGNKLISNLRKEPIVAVHVSLAIVMAGYSFASMLHVSGALAMVVAGLWIGNGLHQATACELQKEHMSVFWKVIDEILNSILFVLIGIEVIALKFEINYLLVGIAAIIIVLVARYISLFLANFLLPKKHRADRKALNILTWAGLRGGISIGLALSLPESDIREALLLMTYVVVAFSIIVRGLSIEKVVKKINAH
ncbi:MAG: cation:proton antiporter [Chitinophagales bacterium]